MRCQVAENIQRSEAIGEIRIPRANNMTIGPDRRGKHPCTSCGAIGRKDRRIAQRTHIACSPETMKSSTV
jgi:hypothetical protein